MFEGFTNFKISVSTGVEIAGVHHGSGPALLLLHGFPQSHYIWHLTAPKLAESFTVVALDLRGYGASTKVSGSASHKEYAKSAMARDCAAVMTSLGHTSYFVCSHDRGSRVAHKLCVDYPTAVKKVIFLDICPTLAMYEGTDFAFAKAYFHWYFLIQPYPFPEDVIGQNARLFAERFMGQRFAGLKVFKKEALDYYISVMEQPDAVHSMCEDYRASASVDMEEAREDIKLGRLINCPVRVLWGKHGVIEKNFDAIAEWKKVSSTGEVEGHNVDCGHYIPEEAPDIVLKEVAEFFV